MTPKLRLESPFVSMTLVPTHDDVSIADMVPLYGSGVRLLHGLPRQTAQPVSMPLGHRAIRRAFIAGLTNSGTNFAYGILSGVDNCGTSERAQPKFLQTLDNGRRVEYQNNWAANATFVQVMRGRERYEVMRFKPSKEYIHNKHAYPPVLPRGWACSADCASCAILVVTRHPLWWMARSCKVLYHCQVSGGCGPSLELHKRAPSLLSFKYERTNFFDRQVKCRTRNGVPFTFPSLVDYWTDFYTYYLEANERQRLFVRYEDLLMQPRRTLSLLCPMVGGSAPVDVRVPTTTVSPKRNVDIARGKPNASYNARLRMLSTTAAWERFLQDFVNERPDQLLRTKWPKMKNVMKQLQYKL